MVAWHAELTGSTETKIALISIAGAGTFEVACGKIEQTCAGVAISCAAKITVKGGTVSATSGSAIYAYAGKEINAFITVSGGTVEATGNNGRAILGSGARLTVTGGTVEANNAKGHAIQAIGGVVTVMGGSVSAT
jgi:hypothetical protein